MPWWLSHNDLRPPSILADPCSSRAARSSRVRHIPCSETWREHRKSPFSGRQGTPAPLQRDGTRLLFLGAVIDEPKRTGITRVGSQRNVLCRPDQDVGDVVEAA